MSQDTVRDGGEEKPLRIKLVAGNSNRSLAEAIAGHLAVPLTKGICRRFADMEVFVEIQEKRPRRGRLCSAVDVISCK